MQGTVGNKSILVESYSCDSGTPQIHGMGLVYGMVGSFARETGDALFGSIPGKTAEVLDIPSFGLHDPLLVSGVVLGAVSRRIPAGVILAGS